ncbi:hypothetical protein IE53DRAFT_309211 [Violaceomyces palustris]|uniref:Uncharacterized protein n=1 Tax=Violaceomyces palustris TaxID=1673888 RepID=A0ACD0P7I6_9BASI|nr:hypothetical protein IE53DRAFT_309211 [Violaceomyces palustris]
MSSASHSSQQNPSCQPLVHLHPPDQPPSFSFVCLGTGGGPLENDCSCYLMKPADAPWSEGSVVVEGGSWLGALTTVLEQTGPGSAFYDFDFPPTTPSSYLRAGLIASFTQSFLISHAHLDHILGLVLGSASLPGKRAVYGLRPTLENILDLFNGKIWPKLASWKEDEPYTMYHMKSLEAQKPYTLSERLSVLPFALSHGLNPSVPPAPPTPTYATSVLTQSYFNKRNSLPLSSQMANLHLSRNAEDRHTSSQLDRHVHVEQGSKVAGVDESGRPVFKSPFDVEVDTVPPIVRASSVREPGSPRALGKATPNHVQDLLAAPSASKNPTTSSQSIAENPEQAQQAQTGMPALPRKSARRPRTAQGSEKPVPPPSSFTSPIGERKVDGEGMGWRGAQGTAAASSSRNADKGSKGGPRRVSIDRSPPSLDSTAFFISHRKHDRDVLFFGDVEPDCVSQSPRNTKVWKHAAQRFVEGKLGAIFLECSFPKNHPTQFLYGHLSVEHLFDELRMLARYVRRERERRRLVRQEQQRLSGRGGAAVNQDRNSLQDVSSRLANLDASKLLLEQAQSCVDPSDPKDDQQSLRGTLKGLGIIIIHVKPSLFPTYAHDEIKEGSEGEGDHKEKPAPSSPSTPKVSSSSSNSRRRSTRESGPKLDPRTMPDRILEELVEFEDEAGLGCRFVMAQQGMRIEC